MTTKWITIDELCGQVRAARHAVLERIRLTPASGVEPCWINVGTDGCPRYSFDLAEVDRWWREINRWRASAVAHAKSAGGSQGPMAGLLDDRGRVRPKRLRESFSAKSSAAKASVSAMSPLQQFSANLRLGTR